MKKIITITLLLLFNSSFSEDFFDSELDSFSEISSGRSVNMDKTASVVSVINNLDLVHNGFKDVKSAVESLPGVTVIRGTLAQSDSYVCRGINSKYNSEVLFMINNTPIKSLAYGNILSGSWTSMSTTYVDKIEVIRGNGSALYGADAFSCVINISLKKNDFDTIRIEKSDSNSVYLSKNFSGESYTLNTQIFAENTNSDGDSVNYDSQSSIDLLQGTNLSNAPSNADFGYKSLDYIVNYTHGDFEFNYLSQNRYNVGSGYGLAQSIDKTGEYSSARNLFNVGYRFSFLDNIDSKFIASYFMFKELNDEISSLYPNGLKGSPELQESNLTMSLDNFIETTDHFLKFGFGYSLGTIEDTSDYNNFTIDYSFVSLDGDDENIYAPEKERLNKFIYLQDEWNFNTYSTLLMGVRYDDYNDFGKTINPRISLILNSNMYFTNKFLYGRAFRAPTIVELFSTNNPIAQGNKDLEAETIDTIEYVLHYNNNDDFTFTSNFYYFIINNDIRFTDIVEGDLSAGKKTQNIGKTKGYGTEIEFVYIFSPFTKIESNYSYQYNYDITSEKQGKRYPAHMVKTTYFQNINDTFSVNFTANYYSARKYMQTINNQKINDTSDTIISSVNILAKISSNFTAGFKVFNIFNNKKYDVYESSTSGLPDLSHNNSDRYVSIFSQYNF